MDVWHTLYGCMAPYMDVWHTLYGSYTHPHMKITVMASQVTEVYAI